MTLTSSQMGVDAHIACRPAQALSFTIGNVLLGFRVTILLGHPEIDHMDDLMASADAEGDISEGRTYYCYPLSQAAQSESCRA
jgi:hypothetical protein